MGTKFKSVKMKKMLLTVCCLFSTLYTTVLYSDMKLKVPSGFFYLLQVKIFCGSDAHFKIVFNFFTEPASELWIVHYDSGAFFSGMVVIEFISYLRQRDIRRGRF